MSEENNKEIDISAMSIGELIASTEKIRKRIGDPTLTKEERDELWEEVLSMGKKYRELKNQKITGNNQKMTPEKLEEILKKGKITEPGRTILEIILAMQKSVETKEDLPEDINEKRKIIGF